MNTEDVVDDDTQDALEDSKSSWIAHEYTQTLLRLAREARKKATDKLIVAARGSTDPRVMQAYAGYEHATRTIQMLEGRTGRDANGEV